MLNEIIDDNVLSNVNHDILSDNIIVIYDFIDEEDVEYLNSIINGKHDSDWEYNPENASKNALINDNYISDKLTIKLNSFLKNKNLTASGFYTIHKFQTNDYMSEHIDYISYKDNLIHAAILYLNDDYTGGELFYTKKNVEIIPKRKSLVVHMSDDPHLVKNITSGTRYSMVCLIWKDLSVLFNPDNN